VIPGGLSVMDGSLFFNKILNKLVSVKKTCIFASAIQEERLVHLF